MKKRAINRTSAPRSKRTARGGKVVLALNAGSSSLKFALFKGGSTTTRLLSGSIDRIGLSESTFTLKEIAGEQTERVKVSAPNHVKAMEYLLRRFENSAKGVKFDAIGHRVVHGGLRYREP